MNDRKILVPVDFSQQSRAALEYAAALAKGSDAQLLIVHVVDLSVQNIEGLDPLNAMEGLDAVLHDVKPTNSVIPCSHRLLEGEPVQAILNVAKEEDVEMIVMGTHGRSGINRMLMGSVAEAVVRKATCPVLTLRHPAEAPQSKAASS